MKFFLVSFLWITSFAFAEVDPCRKDFKNHECQFRVLYSLHGQYDMNAKLSRPEYVTYVDNYYKKYGIEGFLYLEPQRDPLFEHAFKSCNNAQLKEKLLKDFPRGRTVDGKNIYQLLLPDYVSNSKDSVQNFLFSLNALFPEKDNENFKKTGEKFGFPWEDSDFVTGYIETINELIDRIDTTNAFFKRSELASEKEELLNIIERLKPLTKINEEVCSMTKVEEIQAVKMKYKDLFQSSKRNVIGCLLKNEQCELAGELINSGEYPADRLSDYFDSIIKLKNSKTCVETMKSIFMTMLRNGNPIVSNPKYVSVGVLKDITNYYQKYPFDDQYLCGPEYVVKRNNLDDFTENLQNIMEFQGRELMNRILVEKDPLVKESLVNQFADINKLDVDLSRVDPATGKSILHQMADAGDYALLDSLKSKGVEPYSLGLGETDKDGLKPLYYAIKSGEMNKLKFAQHLYSSVYKDAGEMLTAKWYLKKIKTKDPEVKQFIKDFKFQIEADLSHEY